MRIEKSSSYMKNELTNESAQQEASSEQKEIENTNVQRTLQLKKQLCEEINKIKCSTIEGTFTLPPYSEQTYNEWYQSLEKLLKYNPQQAISIPPINRKPLQKDFRITQKRNRLRYRFNVPFFYTAYKITKMRWFHNLITVLLIFNVFINMYLTTEDEESHRTVFFLLRNTEFISSALYCVEMLLHLLAHGKYFWTDVWFVTDFVLLALSIVCPGFVILLCTSLNYDIMQVKENIKFLFILQALRVFRIIPRIHQLRSIVASLASAARSMVFVSILIFIVIYIFAIIGMYLFFPFTNADDNDFEYQYKFSSFGDALTTVFQLLTFDSWLQIYLEISSFTPKFITLIYFIVWLWLGAFIFANIIVGVMVDKFKNAEEKERQLQADKKESQRLIQQNQKLNRKTKEESSKKVNKQLEIIGKDLSQKIPQIFQQFEASDVDSSNSISSISKLLKKMGKDCESIWTNAEICKYFQILFKISEILNELERLEKSAAVSIKECLERK